MVRKVLGEIDLDPATCDYAQNHFIQAKAYFTQVDDGLNKSWFGRVFLNPPFEDARHWIKKLEHEYQLGNVSEAIALVKSALGYNWWEDLFRTWPVCLCRKRPAFIRQDGTTGGQIKHGVSFFYLGTDVDKFDYVFSSIGRIIRP